jgi:hypothetical protein
MLLQGVWLRGCVAMVTPHCMQISGFCTYKQGFLIQSDDKFNKIGSLMYASRAACGMEGALETTFIPPDNSYLSS